MSETSAAAVMVLRAWIEPGSAKPLRVQVRMNKDVSQPFDKELNFVDADDVTKLVEEWLRGLVHPSGI